MIAESAKKMPKFTFFLKFLVLSLCFLYFFKPYFIFAESVNVNLLVSVCNANLICEDVIGENYGSCPSDCEAPPPPPTPTSTATTTGTTGPGAGYIYPIPGQTGSGSTSGQTGLPLNPDIPNTNNQNNNQNGANNNAGSGNNNQGNIIRPPGSISPTGIDGGIRIAPFTTSATLYFKTFFASLLTISWGKTATYELGSLGETWYHQNFATELNNLEPGTRYYYRLELLDSLGRKTEYEGQFITAIERSIAPLPAVVHFAATTKKNSDEVLLSWNLKPTIETIIEDIKREAQKRLDQNISLAEELQSAQVKIDSDTEKHKSEVYVRLTRSDFSYPKDPYEGKVIFEGVGEHVSDFGLIDGKIYYYSIFALNKNGEYSSPAIIKYLHNSKTDEIDPDTDDSNKIKIFDPLVQDNQQFDIEKWLDPKDQTGFCGTSGSVQPALSLRDTFKGISKDTKSNFYTQFISDGRQLEPKMGIISADATEKLIIRVKSHTFEEGDRVGICLFSKKKLMYTNYLLSKNPDGTFELIFPAISTILSGKTDYQFAIGMIKYNGEEMVLERGEISFFMPSEEDAFSWFEILIIVIIMGVILRLLKRYRISAIFSR